MENKYLEAFIMVFEKGSFSSAAEALYITQPTLSNRIQRLEHDLGTTLFNRSIGKKAIPTEMAKKIYPLLKNAYLLIEEAYLLTHQEKDSMQKIMISAPVHMSDYLLPKILSALYKTYPTVNFSSKMGISSRVLQDFVREDMDVSFAYLDHPEYHCSTHSIVPLGKARTVLVCSPNHPLLKKTPISASDLKDEQIIVYHKSLLTSLMVDEYLRDHGITNYKMIELQNMQWMKKMLQDQLGVAFLQEQTVLEDIYNGSLRELPTSTPIPPTPITVLFKKKVPENLRDTIIQAAKQLFGEMP